MKNKALLYGLVWFLILIATATSAFFQASGSHIEYVTVRGENATFQGHGLYKYDPTAVAREGIIWDANNLIVGLPLLAVAIYLTRRGSLRGRLLLGGLLFYFFYNYLMYATMIAFNRLFLVYVGIFALSTVAFLLNLQDIEVSRLPTQVSARFPRRLFIGFAIALSAALLLLWGRFILSIMVTDQFPAESAGMNTLQTQALDLGLVVPLALAAGILLWRRIAWGYFLTAVSVTHGAMMFIAIPAWIVVPLIQEGRIDLVEAVPFLAGSFVGLALAGMFYWSVWEEEPS